jgi:hypothetical protein
MGTEGQQGMGVAEPSVRNTMDLDVRTHLAGACGESENARRKGTCGGGAVMLELREQTLDSRGRR